MIEEVFYFLERDSPVFGAGAGSDGCRELSLLLPKVGYEHHAQHAPL